MKHLFLIATLLSLSGCATIVKSERQTVEVTGGLENGLTKINLPDGPHEITNGRGSIMVTRTKEDIPIEVTCNGVTKKGVLPTKFDWLLGGGGNAIFGGIIGWVVDPLNGKGYNVTSPYNVGALCQSQPAEEKDRIPASTKSNAK